ncbi:signal peptidase I [Methanosarcinales archaeon]|nr:S26 family signal peptidase [Candidatus Methanoperedens sp. BLZ2]KAB2943417.1 MAG: S26 family signal peptidase [Candidatus Methanoperedens sp.]MBZ0176438.1 S26 family signal peptidase [Candidatus Methanoperedens nitroreducens]CAG0960235.1 signal peptidase I [Methanosarcinales archaeon]MCX9078631.1 S26 family signal peptidase [Candidatus Methanoperedens sp.]MCX9086671.1 S26 family signal peptidase [Candidatus Methanoperedens sp.]
MGIKETIKKIKESDNFWIGLFRDFLFVLIVVAIFSSISYIALGRFSPMVAVESKSMVPNLNIGDIIFIESSDRSKIITYEEGKKTGYLSFGYYGDVILYMRSGNEKRTPIIHRAMYYVNKDEPMWPGGPSAPYAGYITKGDNDNTNAVYDQQGSISYLQPVKKEWIIGVARFRPIPLIGCVPLTMRGNPACFNQ